MTGKRKRPAELVTAVRIPWRLGDLSSTLAPGSGASLASDTTPSMAPVVWAAAGSATTATTAASTSGMIDPRNLI